MLLQLTAQLSPLIIVEDSTQDSVEDNTQDNHSVDGILGVRKCANSRI